MPRTVNGVAADDALGEWPVIVRALRADGEDLLPVPDEYDCFPFDFARQHAAVGDVLDRYS